jgi:ribosomal protein S18 acetylase RimI-like enzyme
MEQIDMVKYVFDKTNIDKQELKELFESVNWKTAEYPNRLFGAIKNSSYVISAWDNNELVGLLSAIDDGYINVFLTYLLVKPQYQKNGIGKKMMNEFCKHYEGFGRRILTTETDKEDYYKKFGFNIDGIAMFNKDWKEDIDN